MGFRERRQQKTLRKALSQLPSDALQEALGALLASQTGNGAPRSNEGQDGTKQPSSEKPEGAADGDPGVLEQEARRAKLKMLALQYSDSANNWEKMEAAATWEGEELTNEGALIEALHFSEVEQNPPPRANPSGETLIKQEVSDYDTIYMRLTGRVPK